MSDSSPALGGVEAAVRVALARGERPCLEDLGGEEAVVRETVSLSTSRDFDVVFQALVAAWADLRDRRAALDFLQLGLRSNPHQESLASALDALPGLPAADLRPVIRASEIRVRDAATPPMARMEFAKALLRLALDDAHWGASAVSAILSLDDIRDEYAGPRICRLAAVAYERFRDHGLLAMLEEFSHQLDTGAQASAERGLVGFMEALDGPDLPAIATKLKAAQEWLEKAVDWDGDQRDAQVYLLLVRMLVPLAEGRAIADPAVAERLREEVVGHHMWDEPAAGDEWLRQGRGSELEWLPLTDRLLSLSRDLTQPSWFDVAETLTDVLAVYTNTRAVRPGPERVVGPAIEAAFIRERGLLAHLNQWLERAERKHLDAREARVLRENIQRRLDDPPGKGRGTLRTGRQASPRI
ncbi:MULTISPECIES: hypothetical protein [Roseomonas]|nr:hypothetical protein [Roseomonas mucosa]MDT8312736.1 hypothetical protein [Roseomonas mucosa]MDT8351176.1 hypothetical protein [Roseomonas mucosa]MDT8360111.1 hypothetical protein [Roseomonas mucosa]